MTLKQLIQAWQNAMNKMGTSLTEDGDPGPKTLGAAEDFELVSVELKRKAKEEAPSPAPAGDVPAWDLEARKRLGQKETDAKLVADLEPTWKRVGLPGYKGLSGSARAWCGIFTFAMLFAAGGYQAGVKGAAGAKNWGKFGQLIDHKKMGIPRGAIVHINNAGNCSSGSGNHVGFSNGDCTPADAKSGSFNMLGGNQSDRVSIVAYSVGKICEVTWPEKDGEGKPVSLPKLPILKSNGCKGKAEAPGSTR